MRRLKSTQRPAVAGGRQGINNGDQTILAWGMADELIPPVVGDSYELVEEQEADDEYLDGPEDIPEIHAPGADTRSRLCPAF